MPSKVMEIKPPQHLWHSTRKRQQLWFGGGGSMSALTISKTLRTMRRSITTTIFVLIIADSPRIFLVYPTPPIFCSFSWVLQSCQEKLRIMLTQFFFLGGGGAGGRGERRGGGKRSALWAKRKIENVWCTS